MGVFLVALFSFLLLVGFSFWSSFISYSFYLLFSWLRQIGLHLILRKVNLSWFLVLMLSIQGPVLSFFFYLNISGFYLCPIWSVHCPFRLPSSQASLVAYFLLLPLFGLVVVFPGSDTIS